MEKNFKTLLEDICNVRLDHKRLNDLHISDDVYKIGFRDITINGKTDTTVCLMNTKLDEYSATIRQLAGLRVTNATGVTAEWAHEFKDDLNGSTFQVKAREILAAGSSIEASKFKVVKQLKIRNNQVTDKLVPVYKNDCYVGYPIYFVAARTAGAMPADTDAQKTARNLAFNEAYDTLRKSGVKSGIDEAKSLLLLPVFVLV